MTPDQYCAQKVKASGSSFAASFRFLAPAKRRAITALYAFCREIDDVVDNCTEPAVAAATLAWWQHELAGAYSGRATHPVTQALFALIPQFSLPREQLEEIIDGMAMDVQYNRYPDYKTLQLYCHRAAGVVGLLAAEIFGYSDRATLKYAHELGLAFQLTNIIRDVGEDARRGRIYLPLDELARFNVSESEILASRNSDNFQRLMAFQVERAQKHYELAFAALPRIDRRKQISGLMMAAVYRTLLHEIVDDGLRVLTHRVALPPLRKLLIVTRVWLTG